MKRLLLALAMLPCVPAWASPATLTNLRAIHSLDNSQAKQKLPVDFEGTVTYYDNVGGQDLFVQDGDVAIYVFAKPGANFVPGDRVRVRGITDSDFRPDVIADDVTLLHHGNPPDPVLASFGQLIRTELDCVRVTIKGRVRSAELIREKTQTAIYLNLLVDGGYIDAAVIGKDGSGLKDMLDAEVEITGAVAGKFDTKMQLAGIMLEVQSLADVKVLKRATVDPRVLPITPIDQILKSYALEDRTGRVRVRGTITYYQPGTSVVLQDGARSLWIGTQFEGPLHIGQVADVTGFPDIRNGFATLTQSEVTETGRRAPVAAVSTDWSELTAGKHAFELVSAQGTVLGAVRGAAQDEYVLSSDGHLFSVIYRHPDLYSSPLPPMKQVATGSKVRVTGICIVERGSDPLGDSVAFNVLLRNFDDVQVLAPPSWLTIQHLIDLSATLLLIVLAVASRGWILENRMRRQTGFLAARVEEEAEMERRRSQILEDINSGRELGAILEQIAALVCFTLRGAPCWCRLANGVRIGRSSSPSLEGTEIRKEIPSHAGPAHGEMFVVLPKSDEATRARAMDALTVGVRLAALAIETRGLYSDLVHRSEFDLLTDIPNRFSLERDIDEAIRRASQQGTILGFIFVDLDNFKQVNDNYGHHIGDLFLQQMALHMKHQLRPGDLLARLGGDEFGVLVSNIRSRADLEEIAVRLKSCFDETIVIESYSMRASASIGIAIYPEDGTTRDSLLSAADALMYVSKHSKAPNSDSPIRPV